MQLSSKRVAIIQNRVHKGGRLAVLVNIIKSLNNIGIEPQIVTFKTQISVNEIKNNYDVDIKFSFREIKFNLPMPYKCNVAYFNLRLRHFVAEYDLFINSSNSSIFLPLNMNLISYIHFPQKARVFSKKQSIHFPEASDESVLSLEGITDAVLRPFYRNDRLDRNSELLLANSYFTRQAILQNYPETNENNIQILYPPIKLNTQLPRQKKDYSLVVSTGRFSAIKRQLEQIKIAKQLPKFKFKLIGFKKPGSSYFDKCQKYIEQHKIKNVELIPNASYEKMQNILVEAGFFIHSNRNEPFGITSAQAINNGVIPIVHDSGGQREVVPIAELRYQKIADAVTLFGKLAAKKPQEHQKRLEKLFANLSSFDDKEFRKKMAEIVKQKLG
jgi:glycosyltransferase involved in cell wall biosynthesis